MIDNKYKLWASVPQFIIPVFDVETKLNRFPILVKFVFNSQNRKDKNKRTM